MRRTRWGLSLFGAALLVALGERLFVQGGLAVRVGHRQPGPCRALGEVPGPEDFALDRERGLLYVSSHDRRQPWLPGAIYRIDLHRPFADLAARRLPGEYPPDFYPHGISLLQGGAPGSAPRLYAVVHPGLARARTALDFGTTHRIDIFRVEDGMLRYHGALRDPLLQNPNDLHVRAEDDLYVTRDHGATAPGGKFLEDLFSLRRSSVLHFDGRRFRVAAAGIGYANGVTAVGNRLYVAACLERAVREYAIEAAGQLRPLRTFPVGTAPDNLEPDQAGDLWFGAHAAPLRFMAHARSAATPAPSQAVRLSPRDGRTAVVYEDPGAQISGSSVALRVPGLLLIGAVFDRHVLACREPEGP